jgi:sugar phosphate isomerase/epimerase
MRFGAMNFPVKPILEELEALGALDLDYVELAMDPPQAHYSQLRQQKRSIRQALANHRLGSLCHLPTFVYTADLTPSIRQASLEEILGSLETAAELETEKVVLHPSYIGGLASYVMDQAMALAMDTFDKVARRAAVLGVTVCVENMFPRYRPFVEPEDFVPIFEAFPQFKLVLDIGHAHMGNPAGDRTAGFLNRFSDRLAHIHISDNHGRRDDHLPVGHGSVAFQALMRRLYQLGYDETFTLEIFSQDREDLIRSRQKLTRMRAKARAEVMSE